MKKIKIVKSFAKTLDKLIIIPITKLIVKINERSQDPSKAIEKWLSQPNVLVFISLVLAIFTFIVVDKQIINIGESSAEVLKNQNVVAIYNEESYVVEGLPETVDITIIGSKADLYIAKQAPTREVTVDLSDLKPGQHRIELEYNQGDSTINYIVNPSIITIYIYEKKSDTRMVSVDLLNQESLDEKLVVEDVNYDTDNVVIKGADYKLSQVAIVKALVDISTLSAKEAGKLTINDVPLKAYDKDGNSVDVEIVPSSISVDVTISSPSKTVPVKVIPSGNVAFGKSISSIEQSVSEVTVYGTVTALKKLEYVEAKISVEGLTEQTEFKVELTKSSGIKSISSNSVTVKVYLDTIDEKDVEGVTVQIKGLEDGLKAQGASKDDTQVIVNVKGVKSVLNDLSANDITLYVDLTGLGEGTHTVNLEVAKNDVKVQYTPKVKSVTIVISKK